MHSLAGNPEKKMYKIFNMIEQSSKKKANNKV